MFSPRKTARTKGLKDDQETNPERLVKLKECCDMLLAGGYFRARIPSLSPFDKVVGGMVWSITASNVDVDVDIHFQEGSNIGERIKLSENIIKALIAMGCPDRIMAQQIQGLDYEHIFPVIRWLVRKVMETRQLTGDLVRQLSISKFDKVYEFPEDKRPDTNVFLESVVSAYRPTRKFRKRDDASFETPVARTEATLLEYGEQNLRSASLDDLEAEERAEKKRSSRLGGIRGVVAAQLGGGKAGGGSGEGKDEDTKRREEEDRLNALSQQLESGSEGGKVSGSKVGQYVGMKAKELKDAAEDYDDATRRREEEEASSGKRGAAVYHLRQLEGYRKKLAALQEELDTRTKDTTGLKGDLDTKRAQLDKLTTYNQRVITETTKLEAQEAAAENQPNVQQLKALLVLEANLQGQEAAFKLHCREQRDELMDLLKKIESADSDDETRRLLEIERLHETEKARLDKICERLASANQEIARITRIIDDIPIRAELLQYERRFLELYEMVSEKLVETRKYFALYNTLEDTHRYMQNEVNLLNSIIEGFPTSMKTKAGQQNFLEQFDKILTGVKQTQELVDKQYEEEKTTGDALKDKHNKLLERQRQYFKAVKEFQDEMFKNEKLQSALERIQAGAPLSPTKGHRDDNSD